MVILALNFIVNFIIVLPFIVLLTSLFPGLWQWLVPMLSLAGYGAAQQQDAAILIITALCLLVPLALSYLPFMQGLLCLSVGCKTPTAEEKECLDLILNYLCERANKDPKDFKMYVSNAPELNAFALGTHTICVNRSLLQHCSAEEIVGILAHEMGHLHNKDTFYGLGTYAISLVSNIIIRIYLFIARVMALFSRLPGISYLAALICIAINIQLYIMHFLLRVPLNLITLFSSRRKEYAADRYACDIGLGAELHAGLQQLGRIYGTRKAGLFYGLTDTHPALHKRLERIEGYLAGQQ